MSWSKILTPLSGASEDNASLQAGAVFAAVFGSELACAYTPIDPADLMPWTSDGFLGGAQIAALDSLRDAAVQGEQEARRRSDATGWARTSFLSLDSPVLPALCAEARLADLVVFGSDASHGVSPLADAFQQVLIEERRPILIARGVVRAPDCIAIAWDGGREATNATRAALPLLRRASRVLILTAPRATPRDFDPVRLKDYLAGHGVASDLQILEGSGDAAPTLIAAAKRTAADLLVAGSFGQPRFQRLIFGGVTRGLLNEKDGPPLMISH